MKKFFALALALVLTLAMAVTCFAAAHDITANNGSKGQEIVINYKAGTNAPDTYAVDIVFETMSFTYNAAAKSWDAEKHVEVENEGKWEGDTSAKITVTNHSNVAIQSTIKYVEATTNGSLSVNLTGDTVKTLAAAAGATVATQEATLTVDGTPELVAESVSFTLGTVTVSIAAVVVAE